MTRIDKITSPTLLISNSKTHKTRLSNISVSVDVAEIVIKKSLLAQTLLDFYVEKKEWSMYQGSLKYLPFSCQYRNSIPPGKVFKGFLTFSEDIEMGHWRENVNLYYFKLP